MSDIAGKIDEVIKLGLADLLKRQGFKMSGRTWHKPDGDNWLIVNVQASSGNFGGAGKFTINLGVYFAAVEALAGDIPLAGKPKEYQATISDRVGVLAYGKDDWWVIDTSSDLGGIATDVVEKMRSLGLPWLEAHREISHLSAALNGRPALSSVCAAWLAGDKDEAINRLKAAISSRPAVTAKFSAWAAQNGVAL